MTRCHDLCSRVSTTDELGADPSLGSPEVHGVPGGYCFDCNPMPTSAAAEGDGAAERLWQLSEDLVGLERA